MGTFSFYIFSIITISVWGLAFLYQKELVLVGGKEKNKKLNYLGQMIFVICEILVSLIFISRKVNFFSITLFLVALVSVIDIYRLIKTHKFKRSMLLNVFAFLYSLLVFIILL